MIFFLKTMVHEGGYNDVVFRGLTGQGQGQPDRDRDRGEGERERERERERREEGVKVGQSM